MNQLYFSNENNTDLNLPDLSPNPNGPVRGLRYAPQTGDGRTVREMIAVQAQGSAADIETLMEKIQRALTLAAREAELPGGDQLYLTCRVASGWQSWRSPLLGGQLALGPQGADGRASGVQLLTLTIERADWWEQGGDLLLVSAQNAQGSSSGGALVVDNFTDGAHTNLMDLPAQVGSVENISGGLPTPPVLMIALPDPAYPDPLTFIVGESWRAGCDQTSPSYPGESGAARPGVSGGVVNDPACLGGACFSLDWTDAADQELWSVDLPGADARSLAGGPVCPVLRLSAPLTASEKFWYRWKVYRLASTPETGAVESLVGETGGQWMETGSQMLLGPSLNLPPWPVDPSAAESLPALRLVLAVQAEGAGPHALRIDTLTLLGLDGWRIYRPLNGQPSSGITDNAPSGTLYRFGETSPSHAAEGPGFLLQPGQPHRFTFFALRHDPGGVKTHPIDLQMRVWVSYRPRRRIV